MKRWKSAIALIVAFALTLALGSCAKPPKAELDAAVAAYARAEKDADAVAYAPDSLKRAKDLLARLQSEYAAKKYDSAKTLAAETTQAAEKAIADGKANKERMKGTAAALVETVKSAIVEAEKALAAAKKAKGVKLDFNALAAELETIKASVTQAEADFGRADYKSATEKLQAAQTRIADLTNTVAEAVRAVSKKK